MTDTTKRPSDAELMREAAREILKFRKVSDIIAGSHICARLSDRADLLEAASTEPSFTAREVVAMLTANITSANGYGTARRRAEAIVEHWQRAAGAED